MTISEVTADRAYGSSENLKFLNGKRVKHYIPLWRPQVGQGGQPEGFAYDSKKDRFRCPEGKYLEKCNTTGDVQLYRMSSKICSVCPRFHTCVSDAEKRNGRGKKIRRNVNQPLFNQILRREKTKLFSEKLHQRMWRMEGLFAESKTFHGMDRARYRGRAKVQIQAYLANSVLNLKRLMAAMGPLHPFLRRMIKWLEDFYQVMFGSNKNQFSIGLRAASAQI